ncbi:hypothetical protein [Algoriphagus antarcticus]|uniref:Uncharacterized protein n=1 Tax=Algoriphagus antarcticus TaxID=238540 RepID=A0A3E0D5V2_9BACT|nr:hypothetical protein [Algoriphagus antarcticus]REG76928.1 hypothetical protein C8N25_1488 [Algoriphagus antarcticus]
MTEEVCENTIYPSPPGTLDEIEVRCYFVTYNVGLGCGNVSPGSPGIPGWYNGSGGGPTGPVPWGGSGTGSGGGGPLPTLLPEDKIFTDPSFVGTKADCMYERLLASSEGFKGMIQKFDGQFPVSHLTFSIANLGNNTRGQASPPVNYMRNISLNNNFTTAGVNYRPNLLTAKTIIHEVIHAEMFRKLISLASTNGSINASTLNSMLQNRDYPGMLDYYTRYGINGFQHQ